MTQDIVLFSNQNVHVNRQPSLDLQTVELYQNLCTNPTSEVCGYCNIPIESPVLMRSVSFKFLIGLLWSLLRTGNGENASPYIPECYVTCTGYTCTWWKPLDTDYKIDEDIDFCIDMLENWLAENTPHYLTNTRITSFLQILDSTTTTDGLLAVLSILYNSYDIWTPSIDTAAGAASCTQDEQYSNYSRRRRLE